MTKLRSSLVWLVAGTALALVTTYGCSGADDAPGGGVAATGGSGGLPEAGGSGGTGGLGFDAGGGSGGVLGCTDVTDPTDSDGDGIADQIEGKGDPSGPRDTDQDGTPDYLDADSDDDGVPDSVEANSPKFQRHGPCDPVADADGDQRPDFIDPDSDNDGLPDDQDSALCPNLDCRIAADCDDDTIEDVVEVAAKTDPCQTTDPTSQDFGLYFKVPYLSGPQKQQFTFSTGVKDADIYFLIDTTQSMQGAIDNIKSSLDSKIIPAILNGDPSAKPPIPAIPGAQIGIGTFKDIPWVPWGDAGDDVYGFKFSVGGSTVYGNVSPPNGVGGAFTAPDNVRAILGSLTATGGGDSPEATTQALWLAATNEDYRAVGGGEPWPPSDPPGSGNFDAAAWRANCADPSYLGRACFRAGRLPIIVIVTDAPFHNGPKSGACPAGDDYVVPPATIAAGCPVGVAVNGTKTYLEALQALTKIGAKIVGVSVNTGTANLARFALVDLAEKTGSIYAKSAFDGSMVSLPLVTEQDTKNGDVSSEVVRLIGLLAGQGLLDVTTRTKSYACAGSIDCTGDGLPDPKYDNPPDPDSGQPFDAMKLISSIAPVASTATPKPYVKIDATTFYGVRGDQTVTFEVTADNTVLRPNSVTVVQALLRVQTPAGQALGGPDGIKKIFLVIPPYRSPFA